MDGKIHQYFNESIRFLRSLPWISSSSHWGLCSSGYYFQSRNIFSILGCSLPAALEVPWLIPGWGTQNFQKAFISKISASLSITCDIKLEGTFTALYSALYAEASKRPHTWELRVPCSGLTTLSSHQYICPWKLLVLPVEAPESVALRH